MECIECCKMLIHRNIGFRKLGSLNCHVYNSSFHPVDLPSLRSKLTYSLSKSLTIRASKEGDSSSPHSSSFVKQLQKRYRGESSFVSGSDPSSHRYQSQGEHSLSSYHLPASSRGDSLEAPRYLEPVHSIRDLPTPESLEIPPLKNLPNRGHALQSLDKDLSMGASTLEHYYNGSMDKYDTISGKPEIEQLLETVDAPKDETLKKIFMNESPVQRLSGRFDTPSETPKQSFPTLETPLETPSYNKESEESLHLNCVLQQKEEDEAFIKELLKEPDIPVVLESAEVVVESTISDTPSMSTIPELPAVMELSTKSEKQTKNDLLLEETKETTNERRIPSFSERFLPVSPILAKPSALSHVFPSVSVSVYNELEEEASDVGESLHFSEDSDIETDKGRRQYAVKADEYNFTEDDTDSGSYAVVISSAEEEMEPKGDQSGTNAEENTEVRNRFYPTHRDTLVSPVSPVSPVNPVNPVNPMDPIKHDDHDHHSQSRSHDDPTDHDQYSEHGQSENELDVKAIQAKVSEEIERRAREIVINKYKQYNFCYKQSQTQDRIIKEYN